jgi:hypothetical protein
VLSVGLVAACYQRPTVPRDKPLSCEADASGECPSNTVCIAKVCASLTCATDQDCPVGLACGKNGCGLPGSDDGGRSSEGGIVIAPGFDGGLPTLPGTGGPSGGLTPPLLDGAAPGTNPPTGTGSFDGGSP